MHSQRARMDDWLAAALVLAGDRVEKQPGLAPVGGARPQQQGQGATLERRSPAARGAVRKFIWTLVPDSLPAQVVWGEPCRVLVSRRTE